MPFYVLKIGGSLLASARDLVRALLALGKDGYSFLVVPGGGPMADLVREIYSRGDLSDEAAHWMAILAMEQYAHFLADGTGATLTTEVRRPQGDAASLQILLAYQALLRDDSGLGHTWDYTSDAVAALAAAQLSVPMIKATDVDGIFFEGELRAELPAKSLLDCESCIDQGTIRLLLGPLKAMSIWVLNGADEKRFIEALKNGEGGTIVTG
ncbi:MAG TPA: uridylate kinase [Methanothrix sp.]|nr:uridylate kinase [Methanothrix sp.]